MRTTAAVVFASIILPEGVHHRWATVAECERMLLRGEVSRVHQPGKKSIGRTRPVYKLVPRPEPSKSVPTAPSITFHDVYANLGLDSRPHRERMDKRVVAAARTKIQNYCGVHQHDPMFQGA